ncbi:hypothetical protein MXB_3786 [Myxobolus squamalis]|nr:hypothetical protein MXB_3786 [Myxobolus squamalis]
MDSPKILMFQPYKSVQTSFNYPKLSPSSLKNFFDVLLMKYSELKRSTKVSKLKWLSKEPKIVDFDRKHPDERNLNLEFFSLSLQTYSMIFEELVDVNKRIWNLSNDGMITNNSSIGLSIKKKINSFIKTTLKTFHLRKG